MIKIIIIALLTLLLSVSSGYAADLQDGMRSFRQKDYGAAIEKLNPLATQGNAEAQLYLGYVYERLKDITEAIKWYKKSADNGDFIAQEVIGGMYYEGKGVTKDYVEAYKWHSISWAERCDKNMFYARTCNNATVSDKLGWLEDKMTLSQIKEAQELAREWMKEHRK